jgi:hypothetical protein
VWWRELRENAGTTVRAAGIIVRKRPALAKILPGCRVSGLRTPLVLLSSDPVVGADVAVTETRELRWQRSRRHGDGNRAALKRAKKAPPPMRRARGCEVSAGHGSEPAARRIPEALRICRDPEAPAVKREAEEDWDARRWAKQDRIGDEGLRG